MRLWHKDLIPILPRQQLVAQWRELSSIAGAIQKNGTPNHMLVNFVLDYPIDHFVSYAYYVRQEMTQRGYRTMDSVWKKIWSLRGEDNTPQYIQEEPGYGILPYTKVYEDKMSDFYHQVCLWNLIEKVYCGGITEEPYRSRIINAFNNSETSFRFF